MRIRGRAPPDFFERLIQRDAPGHGLHAEAVPQALGADMGAILDAGRGDDLLNPPEAGHGVTT